VTYVHEDVPDPLLQELLMDEYLTILRSLIDANRVQEFATFF